MTEAVLNSLWKAVALTPKIKLPNNHQYKLSRANDQFEFELKLKHHILPFGKEDGTLVEEISK